ncbi:MAG: tRNA (adenosine(37)-N6)-dimethylallyltransferase MiaA [Ruminococcus sp.]|nr:tRNA (adenosine(37)-N6)-dimethylallyltransferase MiaA [Ruminococcus sp.]
MKVVSVVGPTASGKTKLSVELAKSFNGEIISADSMQIYKGMTIATAKPSVEEMQGIPHHIMDFLPPDSTYSVAMFTEDAKRCIEDISGRGRLPIIVGGTGLYVDSLLNNIRFYDGARDDELTNKLWDEYNKNGVEPLLTQLESVDPVSAQKLSAERNPKRIIRAIEFYHTTGSTITEQNERSRLIPSPYKAIKIGLSFNDRQKLYDRIDLRVDLMLRQGLLEEAREVLSSPLSATSVKAIGYKELAPYINGEDTLDNCVEKLKRETRRSAKRQLTWFRRDKDINWLYADEYDSFAELFLAAVSIINKGLTYG